MSSRKPPFFSRARFEAGLRDPLTVSGIALDLAPLVCVAAFGWGAAPLVLLYWLENILIGVAALFRIVLSGVALGPAGLLFGLLFSGFFVVHYFAFCAVHGVFLFMFMALGEGDGNMPDMDLSVMIPGALEAGPGMAALLVLIAIWLAAEFFIRFVAGRAYLRTSPFEEMFAPYQRIVVLHLGLFAGAAFLMALGDPMAGVLCLVLARAAYGFVIRSPYPADDAQAEARARIVAACKMINARLFRSRP